MKVRKLAIVGATGAVGVEVQRLLEDRDFPCGELLLFATRQSAGKKYIFRGSSAEVQELKAGSLRGVDLAIFSAGGGVSRRYAPEAAKGGCVVIDNSSAFRMDAEVPLIVPEINREAVHEHKGIIANPNCTTAIVVMALWPLHRNFGLKAIIASSYQAVSGAGAKGLVELRQQRQSAILGTPISSTVFPHQIHDNVIPRIGDFGPDGYTSEETKLQAEGRKIMGLPGFLADVTCVRVPVERAHSVSVTAIFSKDPDVERARDVIALFPGVEVRDIPTEDIYPTPLEAMGHNHCVVGRIRKGRVHQNSLTFFVSGDQLLKGAALNAVQIAELLVD